MFSHPARLKKSWFFAVMLPELTIFEVSVKHRSDTFLLKSFKFCYILLNLFSPASIAVVWFCSFIFIFPLFFSNKFLKPTFCPRKFWKVLIVAKFVIIYSNSFILCRTILGVYKSKSLLNNHSTKYLLSVFKIESLKNIWKKITFSYVVDDFFQSDQFLPINSSGKFVEQIFCYSYFANMSSSYCSS